MMGMFFLIGGMTIALLLSWAIQEQNQILGYVVGVTLMFLVALLAVDQMAKDMNK